MLIVSSGLPQKRKRPWAVVALAVLVVLVAAPLSVLAVATVLPINVSFGRDRFWVTYFRDASVLAESDGFTGGASINRGRPSYSATIQFFNHAWVIGLGAW